MIRRKCKSRRGETLIEALISLLIASLALTMLAGMIFKSKTLIEKSREDMEAYTERINALNDPARADSVSDANVTIAFDSGDSVSIPVAYVRENASAGVPIISYVKSGA